MIHSVRSWKTAKELEAIIRDGGLVEAAGVIIEGGTTSPWSGSPGDIPYGASLFLKNGSKTYHVSKNTGGEIIVVG